jgi:hypothetical protein
MDLVNGILPQPNYRIYISNSPVLPEIFRRRTGLQPLTSLCTRLCCPSLETSLLHINVCSENTAIALILARRTLGKEHLRERRIILQRILGQYVSLLWISL